MALNTMFKQISWNLDMIASLGHNQTFHVVDTKLFIENRGLPGLWRAAATRTLILDAIDNTCNMMDELLTSYQNSVFFQAHVFYESTNNTTEEMQQQLNELCSKEAVVSAGLSKLATFPRYQTDSSFLVRVAQILAEFKRLCGRANLLRAKNTTTKLEAQEVLAAANFST